MNTTAILETRSPKPCIVVQVPKQKGKVELSTLAKKATKPHIYEFLGFSIINILENMIHLDVTM